MSISPPDDPGTGEDAKAVHVDQAHGTQVGDYGTQDNRSTQVTSGRDALVAGRDFYVRDLHVHIGDAGGGIAGELRPDDEKQRPTGWVRVSETDPRLLGVHPAIEIPGETLGFLPDYVERDVDADPRTGLRARLRASASNGGFLLVIGGSSSGKTRCLYEAIRHVLPDWQLIYPRDSRGLREIADAAPGRVVVWLDELQRYLSDQGSVDEGMIRSLLQADGPVVVVGTLWPSYYERYIARPAPGAPDLAERERAVVRLAEVVTLPDSFTPSELDRAKQSQDPRAPKVLEYTDYGFTQAMAAAPQLIERWEHADPYARAVVSAALDVARLGVRSPVPAEVLRSAAPGYCDRRARARADSAWFDQALAYAIAELYGAASMLMPVAPPGVSMGDAVGYQVADYLLDRLGATRRRDQVPESFWKACRLLKPADARRIGEAAQSRLRYGPAANLYARACEDVADVRAAERLSRLFEKAERYGDAADILWPSCRAHYDNALVYATAWVACTIDMARAGELESLTAQADAGDDVAAKTLAYTLREQGEEKLLLARARAGDEHAGSQLAMMWIAAGRTPEAVELLWSFAGTGANSALLELASILVEQGRSAEAIEVLAPVADAGDIFAKLQLAELLAGANRLTEALAIFDHAMLEDDPTAQRLWVDILARMDPEDTLALLRIGTEHGNVDAAGELAHLLAKDGRLDEALGTLQMFDRTEYRQVELLRAAGRLDEAIEIISPLARFCDSRESEELAELLSEAGDREELFARARGGDGYAAVALARLWTSEGQAEDAATLLRGTTASGSAVAAKGWIEHLASLGSNEDADKLRRYGLTADGRIADHLPLPKTRFQCRVAAARRYASQDRSVRYDPATRPFWSPSDHLLF